MSISAQWYTNCIENYEFALIWAWKCDESIFIRYISPACASVSVCRYVCFNMPLYKVVISCHFNYRFIVFSTLFSLTAVRRSVFLNDNKANETKSDLLNASSFIVLHVQLWYYSVVYMKHVKNIRAFNKRYL